MTKDQDLYQFTLKDFLVYHKLENLDVTYQFACRNNVDFYKYVTEEDLYRLIEFFDYLGIDGNISFQREEDDNKWSLFFDGEWGKVLFYEIIALSWLNSCYSHNYIKQNKLNIYNVLGEGNKRFFHKIDKLKRYNENVKIIDFGTRRRFSKDWHDDIITKLIDFYPGFAGTSNVEFSEKYNILCFGSMSHQSIMAFQGLYPVQKSQKKAFDCWKEFIKKGEGILLTDTLGFNKFKKDIDEELLSHFKGLRHDSGDPIKWTEEMLLLYKIYDIDPKEKQLVYSDSLNVDIIINIHSKFKDKANLVFGVGTNLTNDLGLPVPQIVIKPVAVNGQPVIKLAEDEGKTMCVDTKYKEFVLHAIINYE